MTTSTLSEVLKQMVDVLEYWDVYGGLHQPTEDAIEAGKQAIAELESQERNFCSRCGKRTADLTTIHTCTPPQRTEQEPVAWMVWGENNVPALTFTKPANKYVFDALYTTPPQRTWVGLTDAERQMTINKHEGVAWETAIAIEQQLKGKNV